MTTTNLYKNYTATRYSDEAEYMGDYGDCNFCKDNTSDNIAQTCKKATIGTVIGWVFAVVGVISAIVTGLILIGIVLAVVAFILVGKFVFDLVLPVVGGAISISIIVVVAALAFLIKIAIPFI